MTASLELRWMRNNPRQFRSSRLDDNQNRTDIKIQIDLAESIDKKRAA